MPIKTALSKEILNSILNSYSQVFFSTSKLLAVFLIVISFFDYGAGLGGLIAVIIANSLAWFLGYNKHSFVSGIYGFNALLVGLGVGLIYQPSAEVYLLIAISAILSFFLTIVFQGVLGKYGLPFLSVPFLIAIWIVLISGNSLTALNISERGIFTYNELYALGGQPFINFYDFLENNIRSSFVKIYFHSLGAIFFQTHLLSGIIISLGLLIYSRITFVLSILGFSVAYLFYQIVGIEFISLGYNYIGFNYILTAIALGGYFLVPGKVSYGWIIILLPAVVLITTSAQQIFGIFKISPYSLPFNMVVLIFLYALKFREQRPKSLVETPVQLGKPEKNLYLYSGNAKRFPAAYPISATLPFFGEWTVNQGHNGEYTHKDSWRHAWDFIITNRQGSQFKNSGDFHEDYFCYGKAVLSPFDGMVIEAVNTVQENSIGNVNTKENWGNTVIVKHNEYLYAKLSHLKYQSLEVKAGDVVKKGQLLGRCGNSGRSPFPHLHFQFQSTPHMGSKTLDYPFGHYLLKKQDGYFLQNFEFPQKGQVIMSPLVNAILAKALHFIPGQRLKVKVDVDSKSKNWQKHAGIYHWAVETNVFNSTYIRCEKNGGLAYLFNNGDLHYFTNFTGSKNSALYWFYLSLYKIPLGFQANSVITDTIPLHQMFGGAIKILQDFIAPIYLFLKVDFKLKMKQAGDILSSGDIELNALIEKKIFDKPIKEFHSEIKIKQNGSIEITIVSKDTKIKIECQNEQE